MRWFNAALLAPSRQGDESVSRSFQLQRRQAKRTAPGAGPFGGDLRVLSDADETSDGRDVDYAARIE